jgi:Plasmid pRiA4b ORF-3-like protein
MTTSASKVHRLKVTLRHVKPPVWRRIEVPSDIDLAALAAVLEAAMGWEGYHLHGFEVGDVTYQPLDENAFDMGLGFAKPVDERTATLGDVLLAVKSKMRWDYDFGDGWEHDVVVEAIEPRNANVEYPICLAGKRSCPPEDCGGPWGYADLLEAIADPKHPEHDELTEWLPPDFDPEEFDVDDTTDMMHSPRPLDGW